LSRGHDFSDAVNRLGDHLQSIQNFCKHSWLLLATKSDRCFRLGCLLITAVLLRWLKRSPMAGGQMLGVQGPRSRVVRCVWNDQCLGP
jgi:hypothetical protein